MNLSISNIAWDSENNSEVYQLLKKYKYTGIEIAPTIWFPENPYDNIINAQKLSNDLENNLNLRIFSMQSICYGKTENIFGTEFEYRNLLNYTKQSIDFAHSINCPNIVFGCPKNRIISSEDQVIRAYEFFNELGNYASNKNVVISIEPNPTIYGTNFLNTTKQVIDFIKELKHPNILLNVDLGTIIYNNESLDILRTNSNLIGHIHLSEPNLERLNVNERYTELITLVHDIEYSKCLSIEMKKQSLTDLEETLKEVSEVFYGFK
ncbi:MAG TPA: endonuclease [Erysipelotrichaceae bacterium]|nr:endonuclease [Erysipelotrichaceae bacterium]